MPDLKIGTSSLLEAFAVDPAYIYDSMVHGSPIPFIRAWPRWHLEMKDHQSPPFRLEVYGLPFGKRERTSVQSVYGIFREYMFRESRLRPRLEDRNVGANVVAKFRSDGPFRLEIVSNPPYASPVKAASSPVRPSPVHSWSGASK